MGKHILWAATVVSVATLAMDLVADIYFADGGADNEGWDVMATTFSVTWVIVLCFAILTRKEES